MADVNTQTYQPLQSQNQGQMNPLQVLQLIGQVNQNKLFNQEFEARQAIGNAYRANTGPNGEINTPGLRSDIGQNGGFRAGEGLAQATQNSSADASLKGAYQQTLHGIFGQLATKPAVTDQDISAAKADAARQGVPGQFIQDYVSSLPGANSKKSQDARKDWFVSRSNLARGPEAIAAGKAVPGPSGELVEKMEGAASRERAAGGLTTTRPPGVNEAQVQTGAGSGAALAAARDRNLNYGQEVFPLEQAISALQKLGPKGTGPGTETVNQLKSFAISNIPGVTQESFDGTVKDYDKAKKYLVDFVNQNGSTGTNDKLAAAFAGNPSVGISNAAAVDVAKSALALRRMKSAQLVEFEKSGLPDSEFAKWAGRWQLGHDPRAFGFDLMTPEARRKVIESFPEGKDGKPGPRDLFKLQVMQAHDAGIIKPPGQ